MDKLILELRNNTKEAEKFFAQKLAYLLGPVELKDMLAENKVKLIDVRNKEDFEISHLPCACSIPKHELKNRLDELSKEEINVIYCYNEFCSLGAKAAYYLAKDNYPVMVLEGGYRAWVEDFRFTVVSSDS